MKSGDKPAPLARRRSAGWPARAWAIGLCAFACRGAFAQSIEPRNYSNAPVGMNFAILGLGYSKGGIAFDPALPVKDPELNIVSSFLAYTRVFEMAGQTGRVDFVQPFASLSGSASFAGQPIERSQQGLADSLFRVSYHLLGAPALSLADFRNYRQDLIVGASVEVSAPTGAYDNQKAVNLSGNRWTIKPEIGLSKAFGPMVLELAAATVFYTTNSDFFGGSERKQDPLYSLQAHTVYNFSAGAWASLSASYYQGGRTIINGQEGNDLQENWRLGATFAMPLSRYLSLKLAASNGLYARTGNNMSLYTMGLQTRWGAGL
ncbi:transporter [Niveibacterium sp. 24ML]|uniref:transporter n=1 Tax=Niveibacterium sp. 24ML TaxID=2985512 RepID=UPI0022716E68|nr:transporter [Niveibacterium sp. 24ML]MCX9156822.1 transporter [Niveibacterium sp. 24ML]